jgi:acetaldehyde dehydrogenase
MSANSTAMDVAIIGSGNIGTDLMIKIVRLSTVFRMAAFVGIDAESDGLKRAERMGVTTISKGIDGLLALPQFDRIGLVFDATSASSHHKHDALLRQHGKQVIDLTPAAIGPYVVPAVNLDQHLMAANVNMVTCGGQATIPIVAAVSRVTKVHYAEIVASIASRSAGPGTRANIDEFTVTTARAIESVGGAARGKAIIVLNPAEPPLTMRDTVFCLCEPADQATIIASVDRMVADVQVYVPGYKLKQAVQFEHLSARDAAVLAHAPQALAALKVSIFIEVVGAAHYLPAYAGNLDIMTSAALRTAERLIELRTKAKAA